MAVVVVRGGGYCCGFWAAAPIGDEVL